MRRNSSPIGFADEDAERVTRGVGQDVERFPGILATVESQRGTEAKCSLLLRFEFAPSVHHRVQMEHLWNRRVRPSRSLDGVGPGTPTVGHREGCAGRASPDRRAHPAAGACRIRGTRGRRAGDRTRLACGRRACQARPARCTDRSQPSPHGRRTVCPFGVYLRYMSLYESTNPTPKVKRVLAQSIRDPRLRRNLEIASSALGT